MKITFKLFCTPVAHKSVVLCSRRDIFGRVVASDTRGPLFDYQALTIFTNC